MTCPNEHLPASMIDVTTWDDLPESVYLCPACGARRRKGKPRLVDTEAAETWTSRPRGTLYRWATEGRITRYGTRGHWGARWDIDELPRYRHVCSDACLRGQHCPPLPGPPPVRRTALDARAGGH